MRPRVFITGVGIVNAAFTGGAAALAAYLGAPRAVLGASPRFATPVAEVPAAALAAFFDETEARRLSPVCRLAVAAARLALEDAALVPGRELGLVIGTEFGDLRSTIEFANGYLGSGPTGLSALLFPNTVMNTMAAATTIAVAAKEMSLTLNAPLVAGELAVAQAALAIAGGRARAILAGGVDQLDPFLFEVLTELQAGTDRRGEGATFLVLESEATALERGARVLGEIAGAAWRARPVRPHGIGRAGASPAIAAALEAAGADAASVRWVYASSSGDEARDVWEGRLLDEALAPHRPPRTSLAPLLGRHAGLGALAVAAGACTARSGLLSEAAESGPSLRTVERGRGLVHAVARGGTQVALVVDGPGELA